MKATLGRMDLIYEANFSAPAFDLPLRGPAILKSIHESIGPRFVIASNEMHVFGGNSLSEVRVRVALFGRNAQIDVTADKWSITFNNLRSEEDSSVCRDCISLGGKGVATALPETQLRTVAISPTLFRGICGEVDNASKHLARVAGANSELDLGEFEGAVQYSGLNVEIENETEDWNAIFNAFRVHGDVSSLIVSCHAVHGERGGDSRTRRPGQPPGTLDASVSWEDWTGGFVSWSKRKLAIDENTWKPGRPVQWGRTSAPAQPFRDLGPRANDWRPVFAFGAVSLGFEDGV